ncbi:GtrA family protein [Henriciella marina]|uniref:GtrA family protein n=1 Tax=Henriciella marina TaxID=453851 RepID=A0ABT4LSX8_9PROT|nr:GtrA family protein [Henriciella marina]MCZ4297227.1 GtrA family protein [Henriciella marina]
MEVLIHQVLKTRIVRFVLVGGLGFLADAGTLFLLISGGIGPFVARVVSILFAMFVTWRLNRAFTFGASSGSQISEAGRYFTVATSVATFNYLLYAGLLVMVPTCPPVLATAIATIVCTLVSFAGYGKFAFRSS